MSVNRTPEQEARESIDRMLNLAGWDVQDCKGANILARTGVAIRNFPLNPGHLKKAFSGQLVPQGGKEERISTVAFSPGGTSDAQ